MFNLEGMIPKLCLIAQEMREDGTAKTLRSAGLQVLSSMVIYPRTIFVFTSCHDACFAYDIKNIYNYGILTYL